MYKSILLSLLSISLILSSCASTPAAPPANDLPPEASGSPAASPLQERLVDSARWARGRNRLEVDGRRFNLDCSGVVLALYYRAGLDLQSYLGPYSGGGVERLYALMDDHDLLYKQPALAPGDLLFWDNSYDRNNNGVRDDAFTHVGMVVKVDENHQIEYIHHNYRKGIVFARMNLLDPDNLDKNSPMRARDAEVGHAPLWLSSHLLRQAGKAYILGN